MDKTQLDKLHTYKRVVETIFERSNAALEKRIKIGAYSFIKRYASRHKNTIVELLDELKTDTEAHRKELLHTIIPSSAPGFNYVPEALLFIASFAFVCILLSGLLFLILCYSAFFALLIAGVLLFYHFRANRAIPLIEQYSQRIYYELELRLSNEPDSNYVEIYNLQRRIDTLLAYQQMLQKVSDSFIKMTEKGKTAQQFHKRLLALGEQNYTILRQLFRDETIASTENRKNYVLVLRPDLTNTILYSNLTDVAFTFSLVGIWVAAYLLSIFGLFVYGIAAVAFLLFFYLYTGILNKRGTKAIAIIETTMPTLSTSIEKALQIALDKQKVLESEAIEIPEKPVDETVEYLLDSSFPKYEEKDSEDGNFSEEEDGEKSAKINNSIKITPDSEPKEEG